MGSCDGEFSFEKLDEVILLGFGRFSQKGEKLLPERVHARPPGMA